MPDDRTAARKALKFSETSDFSPTKKVADPESCETAPPITPTSKIVTDRVKRLEAAIPEAQKGRITMAVALVEDSKGVRSILVGTSEPHGYLRKGVTLRSDEKIAPGVKHAEVNIMKYAAAKGLKVIDIGATRPVCVPCQKAIDPTGAIIVTARKGRSNKVVVRKQ